MPLPVQILPSTSVEGYAPFAVPMDSVPMNSYPVPAPPSYDPGLPPQTPGVQGAIPLAPASQPIGVPIPRDANANSSTTYIFPNRSSVVAESF